MSDHNRMSPFLPEATRGVVLADALSFPNDVPAGYEMLKDEPRYDPKRHLALEPPPEVWTLADLGYGAADVERWATDVAISAPFRVLSDEGVAAAREVALALRDKRGGDTRTASYLSGGVYRSRFLRDFCNCPTIAGFLSEIAGTRLLPHSMPSQQVYVNYAPEELSKAVDTWHTDGIGFDMAILLSDPSSFQGGEFQFFFGTRNEAARHLDARPEDLTEANSNELPIDKIRSAAFPAAGYAVFQSGGMVVHRANRLRHRAERITMVSGYVACDVQIPDPTRDVVADWGEPGMRAEFARHKAWLARAKLGDLIENLPLTDDVELIRRGLRWAIADVETALRLIQPQASLPCDES
jgi:hypothetical protein